MLVMVFFSRFNLCSLLFFFCKMCHWLGTKRNW